jgi:hypothetical protein
MTLGGEAELLLPLFWRSETEKGSGSSAELESDRSQDPGLSGVLDS